MTADGWLRVELPTASSTATAKIAHGHAVARASSRRLAPATATLAAAVRHPPLFGILPLAAAFFRTRRQVTLPNVKVHYSQNGKPGHESL